MIKIYEDKCQESQSFSEMKSLFFCFHLFYLFQFLICY